VAYVMSLLQTLRYILYLLLLDGCSESDNNHTK